MPNKGSVLAGRPSQPHGPKNIQTPLRQLAFGLTACGALTSSWTGIRVQGLNLADIVIVLALMTTLLAYAFREMPMRIAVWAFIPSFAVLLFIGRDVLVWSRPLLSASSQTFTVGTSLGQDVSGPVVFLLRMVLCLVAVAMICGSLNLDLEAGTARHLVNYWVMGATISAAYGVAQTYLNVPDLPFSYHTISVDRAVGLANHPNSLGQSAALVLPICVLWLARSRTFKTALSSAIIFGIVIVGVALSGSRAALLLAIVGVILTAAYFVSKSRSRVRHLWIPLVLFAVLPLATVAPRLISESRLNPALAQDSSSARLGALDQGLELFMVKPWFGSGISIWVGEMVPLILLAGGGIVLAIIFYTSLSIPILRMWDARSKEGIAPLLIAAVLVILFGFLNNSIVERYLYWPFCIGYFMLTSTVRKGLRESTTEIASIASGPGRY